MNPWGGLTEYRPVTASTMEDALDLEARGAPDGSLVRAGFQTAGRGRHAGRAWASAPDTNLLFTVFWKAGRFRVPSFAPSLVVGLGVLRWLEDEGLKPALKWPNDVYLDGRKAAGILVRRRLGASGTGSVHAGLGINLVTPADESFRTASTSLADQGLVLDPETALERLLPFLAAALDDPDPHRGCEERLWRRGLTLELSAPDGTSAGIGVVHGLDPSGSLIWEGPRGLEAVTSGE